MAPFHVIRLAHDALDICRRRVQVSVHGTRGHKHHPLHQARCTSHTGADLPTDKQQCRIDAPFGDDRHVEVETTWAVCMTTAYHSTSRAEGKKAMSRLIDSIVHTSVVEICKLGRTLIRRHDGVLVFFEHQGSSNGPTETIDGRLEHLRGTALGSRRNLTRDIARALLETGGSKSNLRPGL